MPCFNRIGVVVISSYIELPWGNQWRFLKSLSKNIWLQVITATSNNFQWDVPTSLWGLIVDIWLELIIQFKTRYAAHFSNCG